jgi:hypothetical protein
VAFRLHPRVGDRDGGGLQAPQGLGRVHGEVPVGVIDQDLGNGDGIWAVIDDVQLDQPRRWQHDALHAQGLNRRHGAAIYATVGADDDRQYDCQQQ